MMKPMEITGSGRARRRERTKREWRKEWGFRTRSLRVVRLQDAPHTSNRRHILAREMIENERGTAINPDDAVQEKISLSDRFGLCPGFPAWTPSWPSTGSPLTNLSIPARDKAGLVVNPWPSSISLP